jgi:hypothetical protein
MIARKARQSSMSRASRSKRARRGLTLAELLVATTIMLMIAGAVATLAATVQSTNDFCRGYTVAGQHARVALSRIERALAGAVANEQFPGCLVIGEQVGSETLPSTLFVWSPTGTAADAAGLPLVNELVMFSPDPAHPNELLEIRSPADTSTAPAVTNLSAWRTLADNLKSSQTTTKVMLTDRLRTAPITGEYRDSLSPADLRGTVRFRRLMAPSEQEWSQYRAGSRSWQSLSWPLDSYRTTSGTRAVACQVELQIVPGSMATAAATAIPFYGSSLITFELPL